MILTPYELPSNGQSSTSESLNIRGLGFQDMLEYSREYEAASTPLKKYLVDYSWIKKVIPNWQTINLVDLDSIILRWKIESVSENNEFSVRKRCPHCGEINTLNLTIEQLSSFVPIEIGLDGEVNLRGKLYKYECPTLEYFDKVAIKLSKSGRVKDIELMKLIAMLPDFEAKPNQMEDLVINARHKDIQVLKTLSSVYFRSQITVKTRCSNCKGGDWSMGVSTLIDNPFLSLVLTTGSIEDQINFKQVRRTE